MGNIPIYDRMTWLKNDYIKKIWYFKIKYVKYALNNDKME
jgi:hypothetical protein